MRKARFIDNSIYHVFNRGIEKRPIFMDDQDHYRFIHNLFELNNENQVINSRYYFDPKITGLKSGIPRKNRDKRALLVDVLTFALMPNHFHLLLKQRKTNGITKFMQKVSIGYVMYFNQKYERVGGLFQGRFKSVMVERNEYFQYLPHYIHLNPLGLKRDEISKSWRKEFSFLEKYKWSSFPDYIGKKNFTSVTKRGDILRIFGGEAGYRRYTEGFLKDLQKEKETWPESIQDVMLD